MQLNLPQIEVLSPIDIPKLLEECKKISAIKDVPFLRVYPDDRVTSPIIVWRIIRRVPGNEGKETKRPRVRSTEYDEDSTVKYMGQWMTTVFQFDIIAPTDEEADSIMLKFEQFMKEAVPALNYNGVDHMIFDEQLTDYSAQLPKEIPVRTLRYVAVMSVYTPLYTNRIAQIAIRTAAGVETAICEMIHGENDIVTVPAARILGMGNSEDSDDYILSIDYDLVDIDSACCCIRWRKFGLRPKEGDTYYVRYAKQLDPAINIITSMDAH